MHLVTLCKWRVLAGLESDFKALEHLVEKAPISHTKNVYHKKKEKNPKDTKTTKNNNSNRETQTTKKSHR